MATLIEREPTTKRATAVKAARARSLNRLRGSVARRSAKALWADGYRQCALCQQEIRLNDRPVMYRAPIDTPRGQYFVLADNSHAVIGHRVCPPLKAEDAAIVGTTESGTTLPLPRTETANCWACRNCGAGVDWRIDTCLLCGYTREKCDSCGGTGSHDVGSLIGGEMPCGCDDGYYYPPVEVLPAEDPNDCAGCGDRPAVRDEEGNLTYPRYTHAGKPPVGVCGWCEREGIRV